MAASHMTAEQAQQWWQQNGATTTHTGGGVSIPANTPWAGGTAHDRTVCGSWFTETTLPNYASCGCYVGPWLGIDPPPRCAAHAGMGYVPMVPATTTTSFALPSQVFLTDADIDRIARRVVELLRAALAVDAAAEALVDRVVADSIPKVTIEAKDAAVRAVVAKP